MENYIVINGKKAELTEEQLEKLGIKSNDKVEWASFFERNRGASFSYINAMGIVHSDPDEYTHADDLCFDNANYCHDETLMNQRALHETLNRHLWRASVITGELDNPWCMDNYHYYIYYDKGSGTLKVENNYMCHIQGTCYFPSEESAQSAIDNIVKPFMEKHPDFVW